MENLPKRNSHSKYRSARYDCGICQRAVIHAPCSGAIRYLKQVGDLVEEGEVLAVIGEMDVRATLTGYLRGAIRKDTRSQKG